jgi:hypothetical protein
MKHNRDCLQDWITQLKPFRTKSEETKRPSEPPKWFIDKQKRKLEISYREAHQIQNLKK